jgi:hypothetical protein
MVMNTGGPSCQSLHAIWWPNGLLPGQKSAANCSLTTATGGAPAWSSVAKPRPAMIGMRRVPK